MKKRSILIGLSLATGVVSSLLLRKEKQKNENRQNFIGNWRFTSKTKEDVTLEIANDYSLTIEGKPLTASIVELTPTRLVLLDTFGYHLVLEQKGSVITLYDEAEDCHYSLTKSSKIAEKARFMFSSHFLQSILRLFISISWQSMLSLT